MVNLNYTVVEIDSQREKICRTVLQALPQWFGIPEALENYVNEAKAQPMFACYSDDELLGMCSLKVHSPLNLEIAVIGVMPKYHRKGVGSILLESVCNYAIKQDVRWISVKTIAPDALDEAYQRSWNFYMAQGFELFEVFPYLWDEHNPCALLVKFLNPSASHHSI